jgi:hypothetical protein
MWRAFRDVYDCIEWLSGFRFFCIILSSRLEACVEEVMFELD